MSKKAVVKSGDKTTAKYWATEINTVWRKTAEAYVEMGQLLLEAKKTLKASTWKDLLDNRLEFDDRKARRLMNIAGKMILIKPAHVPLLPPSYSTLDVLANLDDKALATAFRKGDIHPNMERSDAEELIKKTKPKVEHSRDAEDAEVIETKKGAKEQDEDEEQVDEEEADEHSGGVTENPNEEEDDDKPIPTKKKEAAKPVPNSYDQAFINWSGSIDSLAFFCEQYEAAMQKKGVTKLPVAEKKLLKNLHALLGRFLKDY